MAYRGCNQQIEHLECTIWKHPYKLFSKSRKWMKKVRNRLIRRNKNYEINPKLNQYNGWEY